MQLKNDTPTTKPVVSRIPAHIHDKIREEAVSLDITMSSAIAQIVTFWADKYLLDNTKVIKKKLKKKGSEGYGKRRSKAC